MIADAVAMRNPIRWTKLPFHFDPALLRSDLAAIEDAEWVLHFNQADFAGEWSGVSLRSTSGRANDIAPRGNADEFIDTPLMARCPHLSAVIQSLHFPIKGVRLLRLHAGSRVKEHMDRDLGLADGELRIHVPVETNEHVEFIVANRMLPLKEGETWYIDFSQPHRIVNGGSTPRTHLIIDGNVNEWAKELLLKSTCDIVTETFDPPGMLQFDRFRALVFEDVALQKELIEIRNPANLVQAVAATGARHGFVFSPEDADSVLQSNRRDWILRTLEI
jgi:Aspartyl/Asparaginyl beta-hydroxylase